MTVWCLECDRRGRWHEMDFSEAPDHYRSAHPGVIDTLADDQIVTAFTNRLETIEPLHKCLRCLTLCEPGFACVDGVNPSCPRPCRPVAEGGRLR